MEYRTYGRTGLTVSEIGLGGHQEGVETGDGIDRSARFFRTDQERARIVGRALDGGITYLDTTYGCEIASLGRVLRLLKRRDGLFVSAMRVDFFSNLQQDDRDVATYTREEVEGLLTAFGFDAVDQLLLGAVSFGNPLATPTIIAETLATCERLRDEGKLRFVGFSCHEPDYAARLLDRFPQFDAVMTPYSFANREAEGALAATLTRTGAAWIGMKSLVWHLYGLPVTVLRYLAPGAVAGAAAGDQAIATLALRYILLNPQLATCVPAMNSVSQVDENLAAAGRPPLNDAEMASLTAYGAAMIQDAGVPLAIGGLFEENLRVRHYALALLEQELGYGPYPIVWDGDDAEDRARAAAADALARLRRDDRWAALLPEDGRLEAR